MELFSGREVLRQQWHEEMERKVGTTRELRGLPGKKEAADKLLDGAHPGTPPKSDGQSTAPMEKLLAKEDPDYIDEEENAALEAALATNSVDAVIAFAATLSTPMGQRADASFPDVALHAIQEEESELVGEDEEGVREEEDSAELATRGLTSPTWGASDPHAENDDIDTQNEHWRKVQVRTPVDVPLDLLPPAQRLETLQVQEDMKIFSEEMNVGAVPPKRYLRGAWWLPRNKWRVMDPEQPATLQNPHRPRDFSAEGHTYLPMGQELLRNGVSIDKLDDDDKKSLEFEKTLEGCTAGKRYKEFLISEGKHIPHYLEACKVGTEDPSWRAVQRTIQATNAFTEKAQEKSNRDNKFSKHNKSVGSLIRCISNNTKSPRSHKKNSPKGTGTTPRLPDIHTPRTNHI